MTMSEITDGNLTGQGPTKPLPKRRSTDGLTARSARIERSDDRMVQQSLLTQLCEANQNLVLATFTAQDLQIKAELASRAKEDFLCMLAHELRNPLAPIVNATLLLATVQTEHPLLPKLHGVIKRQSGQLVRLVNDLLDASRIESGKITLKKSTLLLNEVIDAALETVQPFINAREHNLSVQLAATAVFIHGDAVRLTQLFSNLLLNAAKFTPEHGHISVTAVVRDNMACISVKDDGAGISALLLPSIFDLFSQGPQALDQSQEGLGIGLSLARAIAQLHGGKVEAQSAGTGLGSEFTVTLPLSTSNVLSSAEQGAACCPLPPCSVLLIDDSEDSNTMLKELLTLAGCTVSVAEDGADGCAMAGENNYDVLICDLGLTGISGYRIVSELRMLLSKPLPYFIALTGYDHADSRMRAASAGFDEYVVKPVHIDTLVNLICSRSLN